MLGRRWTLDGGVCTFCRLYGGCNTVFTACKYVFVASRVCGVVRCGVVGCGAVRVGQCAGCVQPWEAAGSASEHITGQLSVCVCLCMQLCSCVW